MTQLWLLDHAPIMGGAEVFALKLARFAGEAPQGPAVRLACPGDSELARRAAAAGVTVVPIEFPDLSPRAPIAIARGVAATRALLASAGEDAVIVANSARTQAYVAAAAPLRRRRPPVVHLVHEQESAARPSARFVYRRLGSVVTIGANVAAVYRRALPGVDVRRINNFLVEAPNSPPAAAPGGAPPALGVLARMIPEKGIRELVGELAAHGDAWSTLRVGAAPQDPAYVAEVESRLRDLGLDRRVELLGEVADVPGFLAGIDVLVAPSIGNEGQPTVILEALAHGRPVVVRGALWSSDFEGLPVVPYRDASDIAEAIATATSQAVPSWDRLAGRFGPQQAIDGLVAAAQSASTRS